MRPNSAGARSYICRSSPIYVPVGVRSGSGGGIAKFAAHYAVSIDTGGFHDISIMRDGGWVVPALHNPEDMESRYTPRVVFHKMLVSLELRWRYIYGIY